MLVDEQTQDEARKLSKKLERQARPHIEAKIKYGTHSKRVEAAKRYAAADPSDPFAYARAMTHLNNGIAGFTHDGRDAFYDATENMEEKFTSNHERYTAINYTNRVRP